MFEKVFETERSLVRRWCSADLDELVKVYGDREAMKWVGDGRPLSESECREWLVVTFRNYKRRGYGMFAVELKGRPRAIGFCGIVHPGDQEEPEVKYAYLRCCWGQGIATEVLRGLVAYGTEVHGLMDFVATTAPNNCASHAVLKKAGFLPGELFTDEHGDLTQPFLYHATQTPSSKA
ncbi:N-acetyltransferase GCN5 [Pseudorhodoferax aquiterrae]|uniref:N-acetyltransferase GCN5 n=1 Tax=Pseudorhodoferax aquiterrae TaxID=747304 RepID=A0ABQ3GIX3_9BURK|nr:GNAT family N-acetyltransferase [Pseudorhodoferax aquiterrae]GHD04907.1 N-acetyltransferase GCN5 [Pseudorhodoferax aquiterrae]